MAPLDIFEAIILAREIDEEATNKAAEIYFTVLALSVILCAPFFYFLYLTRDDASGDRGRYQNRHPPYRRREYRFPDRLAPPEPSPPGSDSNTFAGWYGRATPVIVQHIENDPGRTPVRPASVHHYGPGGVPSVHSLLYPQPDIYINQPVPPRRSSKLSTAKTKLSDAFTKVQHVISSKLALLRIKVKNPFACPDKDPRYYDLAGVNIELPVMRRSAWQELASGSVPGPFTPSVTAADVNAHANLAASPEGYYADHARQQDPPAYDAFGHDADSRVQRPQAVRVVGQAIG